VARGSFIVIDGVDGCGKTTQAGLLVRALTAGGGPVPLHLREPGSTALGERLRAVLFERELELDAAVEALLFAAARRQMLSECVSPALARGLVVVCERFHSSTAAYQGWAGGAGEERVLELLAAWAGEPRPDLVLVLDLDPRLALERRGAATDRIEDKGGEYLARVAEGFRRYAARVPEAVLVDGAGTPADVERAVLAEVRRVLG